VTPPPERVRHCVGALCIARIQDVSYSNVMYSFVGSPVQVSVAMWINQWHLCNKRVNNFIIIFVASYHARRLI
jgi:hypothetical protein